MNRRSLILYSASHFWVDLSCAFLLFRTLSGEAGLGTWLLLYNFCAFALQMPLGLMADRLDRNGFLAALGCFLTAGAVLSPVPWLTVCAAGVGNALFHLGGGIDVLNKSERHASALGIFVSPGALGLYIGTLWGKGSAPGLWVATLGLLLLGVGILLICGRRRSGNAPLDLSSPTGLWPVLPLFLVVVLRSYMGMNQSFDWRAGAWAPLLTLALVLGKTAGGLVMDILGPRRTAAGSLGLAAALYLFSALPLPGTIAVFLFNMTMPVTLWAVARVLPGARGFTFGLLTFGLFLGLLPSALGWPNLLTGPWSYGSAALISLVLLWPALGKKVTGCS